MADLEIKNVSKSFNGVYALKNASLECNRGEVHALLGENGAGKSTLLKVLSGAHQADSGEIRIFGETAHIKHPTDAVKYGIGIVYQELTIIPDLTVSENIFIGRIPKNKIGAFNKKRLREMTKQLFDKYGVDDINPDAKAGSLSLSQRQMIEILRVLSKEPAIIIFDEATSALTDNRVQWLLGLARKLADSGKIVIFISHRMSEIQNGCDKITILRNGKTVGEISVDEVAMDELIEMMLGRKMAGYFPEKAGTIQEELALEVKDLKYGHELNGVNLEIRKGEVLGIGGLAGQGQAELLQALYGVIKAQGTIKIDGKEVKIKSPKKSMKKGIALIPEERATQGLLLPFSIGENISLSSLEKITSGPLLSRKKEMQIINNYMKALSIKAESHEQKVMNLSGGNQQKVVMAKMLATNPSLLLMHDITRGVDVGTKKEMFTIVRNLAQKGNAIIFFSTDVEELVNVCDRVLVMYDGKIGANLSEEALTKENIIEASIGAN